MVFAVEATIGLVTGSVARKGAERPSAGTRRKDPNPPAHDAQEERPCRPLLASLVSLALLVFLAGSVSAQWSENFDAYPDGEGMVGRTGWAGWDENPAVDATITRTRSLSPPNSLGLRTATDLVRRFRVTSGRWTFRAQVFIPSGHTGATWVILMNNYQPFNAYGWSSQIRFQGGRVTSHGGDNFFSRAGASAQIVSNQWVELRVDIDLDRNEQVVSYNGAVIHRTTWHYSGIPEVQALDLFSENGSAAFFDDLVFERAAADADPDCNQNGVIDSADLAAATSDDCDGDGIPDECLVATELTFAPAVPVTSGAGAAASVASDLDGDGDLDVAIAVHGSNNVTVLRGDGEGGFAERRTYPVGFGPVEVTALRADADDRPDLATANNSANSVSILRNNGDGTFAPKVDVTVPGTVFAIAAADIERDGDDDLVAGGGSGTLWVFRNDGAGSFALAATIATGAFTNAVKAADMDGDGDIDLVSGNNSTATTVSVHRNNGSGGFGAPRHYPAGEGAYAQDLADLDGDGAIDVVSTGTGDPNFGDLSSSAVLVFRNSGDTLGTLEPVRIYPVGSIVEAIAAGDLDGDGYGDVTVAGAMQNVWVLPNDRRGGFGQPVGLLAGDGPTSLVAADFTGDDQLDLVVTNFRASSLSLLVNQSTVEDRDCNDNGEPDACDIAAGLLSDANADGVPDECAGQIAATFLRGDCNGDGEVRGVVTDALFVLNFNFIGGMEPTCIAACDVDGDGEVRGVVTDAIYLLSYNFLGGPEPAPPYPACGPGLLPADEALGCAESSDCP